MTTHRGKIVVTLAALATLAGCGGAKSDHSAGMLTSQALSSSTTAPSPSSTPSTTSSASSASSAPSGAATSIGGASPSAATSAPGAASDGQGANGQGSDGQGANGKSAGKTGSGSSDSRYTGASVAVPKAAAVSISIPAIGLNHALTPGGLSGGVLSPPSGVIQQFTGYGRVSPGQAGISVLAGHVTWNGPDVFYRLPNVPVGSKVSIAYADGTHKDFVVTSKASVNKTQLQNDARVWGSSSSPVVALVTCDANSSWMSAQHHANNYVVWARPV